MGRTKKAVNLVLDTYGSFLGMEKGCIILRDRNGKTDASDFANGAKIQAYVHYSFEPDRMGTWVGITM
jgi:hypothetical protein